MFEFGLGAVLRFGDSAMPTRCSVEHLRIRLFFEVVFLVAFLAMGPVAAIDKLIIEVELAFAEALVFDEVPLVDVAVSPIV